MDKKKFSQVILKTLTNLKESNSFRSKVWRFTGEDIRIMCEEQGLYAQNNNAWGGIICQAVNKRIIEKTGKMRKTRLKQSKNKRIAVYRFVK